MFKRGAEHRFGTQAALKRPTAYFAGVEGSTDVLKEIAAYLAPEAPF
jgi:hypothetical protein